MQAPTLYMGSIKYTPEQVLTFPKGLPGFEEERRFLLLRPEPGVPLSYLQSLQEEALSWLLADPFAFYPDYRFTLPDADRQDLEVERTEDLLILAIVTTRGQLHEATVNLKAPLVINMARRIGKQVILDTSDWGTRQPLFPHLRQKEG